ncbi:hypothetical protein DICVIV_00183 [Dictyocaulus viviparus]|uniref:Uncharacterized protein n=1 Tax=Dictyocaulus viviparus TaxID=29172 RepID=A0A0D8YCJ1_DICVI|nr:hypothetical protein DICVIV_00183 [Dictyocaulus viviparus]
MRLAFFYVLFDLLVFTVLFVGAQRLRISTTYQAEDIGLEPNEHPQCRAWILWWKTQKAVIFVGDILFYSICPRTITTIVDLTSEELDLLAYKRRRVLVTNDYDAYKYHLPVEVLGNYTEVDIDFENICRLHPRVLRIASVSAARKHHLNLDVVCRSYADFRNANTYNTTVSDTVEIESVTNQAGKDEDIIIHVSDLTSNIEGKFGLNSQLFEIHQSIAIFASKLCNGTSAYDDDEPEDIQYYTG